MRSPFYLCLYWLVLHLASSQPAQGNLVLDFNHQLEVLKANIELKQLLQTQFPAESESPDWQNASIPGQLAGNVSQQCQGDLAQYESDLVRGEMYALLMFDASGKPPSGILWGNTQWLGSYSECKNITKGRFNITFDAQYYLVYLTLKKGIIQSITHGVCVPNSCSSSDISQKSWNTTIFYRFLLKQGLLKEINVRAIEDEPIQNKTIAAICICSCLAALLLTGTTYDVLIHQPRIASTSGSENTEEHSTNHRKDDKVLSPRDDVLTPLMNSASYKREQCESVNDSGMVNQFLLCFSLYTNTGKLLSTKQAPGSIRCLHGIRFLSLCWVILGHTHVYVQPFLDNIAITGDTEKRFTFQVILNGNLSVDSFFVLSGLLMSYGLQQQMHKCTENGKHVPFGMMYLHRYLRLTPTYLFVIMLYVWVYPYLFKGPLYPPPTPDPDCVTKWWTNILYINNFVDPENMCMIWTWYLAADVQLFVIGVPLAYTLFRWRRFGFAMMFILLLASFIATALIDLYVDGRGFNTIYIKPYCQVGPYLVGVAVGWLFFQTKGKIQKTKTTNLLAAVCWAVATASALAVVYGLYDTYHGTVLTTPVSTLYQTVYRPVWGMAVGWVVIACYHEFGVVVDTILSWGLFVPLSRLTYSAYLVQNIVIYIAYRSRETLVHYTTLTMIYFYLGNLVISYSLAFLVSVAVETPMMRLEKLIFKK